MSCPASPSLRWILGSILHLPGYNAPLRLPHSLLWSLRFVARSQIPCNPRLFCVPLRPFRTVRQATEAFTWRQGKVYQPALPLCPAILLQGEIWLSPVPEFPLERMPCSHQTTVVSCLLALSLSGLLPSGTVKTVGFPSRFPETIS
jgi:hypothetical protein